MQVAGEEREGEEEGGGEKGRWGELLGGKLSN